MQDDQTSLVRLETGDNDQKKEMYQESIYEGIDQRRTIFHISIQLDMFLTPCWSFELILVYYHFTFVSLCKLHLLYTVYAWAKPLAWLKRKANFSLMHSLDTKELKIMAASSFHVSILGELFA